MVTPAAGRVAAGVTAAGVTPVRALLLSWEYPPLVHGGLGRHVHQLAEALVAAGHEVTVVTRQHADAPADAVRAGVRVVRMAAAAPPGDGSEFLRWVFTLNAAMARAGRAVAATWRPDVVHAHDWVAGTAGLDLARSLQVPLIVTLHATEAGLWNGWLTSPLSRARHDVEARLLGASARTIVCSEAMQIEVAAAFGGSSAGSVPIPNAVSPARWRTTASTRSALRAQLGISAEAPLLVQAGRLEWEKGGDVSISALAQVRRHHAGARLVIAGAGSRREAWRESARRRRVARSVSFPGHLDDHTLAALLGAADVVLVPSSYEPFGMVALEASAAGTPVVAGDTGGLREVVVDGATGLLVPPRDSAALATAIRAVLGDARLAARLVRNATEQLEKRYAWPIVAGATAEVYADAVATPRPLRHGVPAPVTSGNVIDRRSPSVRAAWRHVRGG